MTSRCVRVLILSIGALLAAVADLGAQNVIFVVRHAERVDESTDAALSAAGRQRAEQLARHLASAGVTAIHTTQFQRTIKTAEPLATRLHLTMASADTAPAELVRSIRQRHPTGTVLIVGHTNTIPEILAALGYKTAVQIGSEEYDNLFVVVPKSRSAPTVVTLKY